MDISGQFSPEIAKFVDVLVQEGRFGMCGGVARVSSVKSGAPTLTAEPCADRFRITLPFAGYSLNWDVIFNHARPEDPPDFILGEDEDFYPDIESIKSLDEWHAGDSHSLLRVVEELLEAYQVYQQEIISTCSMLHFEYSSLLEEQADVRLLKTDIEVHVTKKPNRIGPINFLMKLPIDFSRIPTYLTKDCPGEDSAVLLVTFQTAEGAHGKVTPQLYLSPRVEHCLGGAANLRIPGYPSGSILLDYVPTVADTLQSKVNQIAERHERRKDYVAGFIAHFGRALVEFDAESFRDISFLLEWHNFFFLVSVDLSDEFPGEQPVLTLQSVYHEGEDGRPYSKSFASYPYSPRWSALEMAERARAFLLDSIANFQRESVSEGSLQ